MKDLARKLAPEFGARLNREAAAPVAVAFSGGGDSLALLLAAQSWARDAGRQPRSPWTVDHGLRQAPGAPDWAAWCQARARRLGTTHRTLAWSGPSPKTGLAAAARNARHRLIAGAARDAGAAVILFGHTADDVLESRAMRADGVGVSDPRAWGPSPVWPDGRGLFHPAADDRPRRRGLRCGRGPDRRR